jgi:L-2,4-diaminobutyric acid acetyltransferase
VAVVDGEVAGFVLGYLRPDDPGCLFVWQIAVDGAHRGKGLSTRLLDSLLVGLRADGAEVARMETTITDDNAASQGLFRSFAARWGAEVEVAPLFLAEHFPDGHDGEPVYRIGPLAASAEAARAQD